MVKGETLVAIVQNDLDPRAVMAARVNEEQLKSLEGYPGIDAYVGNKGGLANVLLMAYSKNCNESSIYPVHKDQVVAYSHDFLLVNHDGSPIYQPLSDLINFSI